MPLAVVALLCYLLGSLPFAHAITRLVTGQSIREVGEGNVGARNVAVTVGRLAGVATALLDALKGAAACLLALRAGGSPVTLLVAGLAVMLGHGFPIWLRFRGGIGLGTASGFMAVLFPITLLAAVPVFYLLYRLWANYEFMLTAGFVAILLGSLAERGSLPLTGVAVAMLALSGLKRLLDDRHRRTVQARSGWVEPTPDFDAWLNGSQGRNRSGRDR